MTYRPTESMFGPPLLTRLPSYAYLFVAIGVTALVIAGEHSPSGSWLFHYVVERDVGRVMSMRTLAACLLVGSIAAVMRAGMRGVRVYADGVELRDVHSLVLPRVRRYRWPQLEGIVLDMKHTIALDLWVGSREFLPIVRDRAQLANALEKVAVARAIPVRGGGGLDELPDEVESDANEE
jgi:hypothetical protein